MDTNDYNGKPAYRLGYVQVLAPAPPGILPLAGALSRRAAIGHVVGLGAMLAAFGAAKAQRRPMPARAHRSAVQALALSPAGESLVSGASSDDRDSSLKVWHIDREHAEPERDQQFRGAVAALAFSPDERLAVADNGGPVEIRLSPWTGTGFTVAGVGASDCRALLYSEAGGYLLCAGNDGVLSVWGAGKQYPERYYSLGLGPLTSLQISPSGHALVAASAETAKLFQFSSGTLKAVADVGSAAVGGDIRCVAFAGESLVAIGTSSAPIVIVHSQGFTRAGVLRGHTSGVNCLIPLHDGRVVSGGDDRVVRIWNAKTGILLRTLYGHSREVCSAVASADSKTLFTGDRGGGLIRWDLVKYRLSRHLADSRLSPSAEVSHVRPPTHHRRPDSIGRSPGVGSISPRSGTVTYGPTIHAPCTASSVPAGYICQCNCVPY